MSKLPFKRPYGIVCHAPPYTDTVIRSGFLPDGAALAPDSYETREDATVAAHRLILFLESVRISVPHVATFGRGKDNKGYDIITESRKSRPKSEIDQDSARLDEMQQPAHVNSNSSRFTIVVRPVWIDGEAVGQTAPGVYPRLDTARTAGTNLRRFFEHIYSWVPDVRVIDNTRPNIYYSISRARPSFKIVPAKIPAAAKMPYSSRRPPPMVQAASEPMVQTIFSSTLASSQRPPSATASGRMAWQPPSKATMLQTSDDSMSMASVRPPPPARSARQPPSKATMLQTSDNSKSGPMSMASLRPARSAWQPPEKAAFKQTASLHYSRPAGPDEFSYQPFGLLPHEEKIYYRLYPGNAKFAQPGQLHRLRRLKQTQVPAVLADSRSLAH